MLLQDPGFDHLRSKIRETRNPWESPESVPSLPDPLPETAEDLVQQPVPESSGVAPSLMNFIEEEVQMENLSDDDFFSNF